MAKRTDRRKPAGKVRRKAAASKVRRASGPRAQTQAAKRRAEIMARRVTTYDLSADEKAALEGQATLAGTSVSALLARIAREWLGRGAADGHAPAPAAPPAAPAADSTAGAPVDEGQPAA